MNGTPPQRDPKPKRRSPLGWLRLILGWFFLIAGLFGLFLPFLQGILFLAIGALLLSPDIKFFRNLLNWLEQRYPRLTAPLKKWRTRLKGNGSDS